MLDDEDITEEVQPQKQKSPTDEQAAVTVMARQQHVQAALKDEVERLHDLRNRHER